MDLPELSSADLEALFKPLPDQGAYQELEQTAAWLLDPSPVGSNDPPLYGAAAPSLSPTGVAGVPADLLFSDAFLDGLPGLFPLPDLASDSFAPPGYPAADSSGGGSGSGSGSGGGAAAFAAGGVPAAAVTSVPASKGKGGKKELTEEQKERIKAKNRRAQNRYREKQKAKAAGAEAEYSNTATELQRLRLENTRLQERQATMQQVLAVREDFVSSLEGGKAASDQEAAPPAALPCNSGSSASTAQQAVDALALCHSSGSGGSGALDGSGGSGGSSSSLDVSRGQCCPLTGLTLSQIAELKQTPPEALQRGWRSIAQRLTSTMQQLEAAEGSPDGSLAARSEQLQQEVHSILREGQSFCFEHAVYQPTNVQRLFAAALDDGRSQSSAEDMGKWGDVAAALQLSEVQLGRLASARAQFVRSIGEVCAERRQIFERLQALTEEVPTSLRALQHVTATWLEVHEATADLTANMNQEHCVCMSFVKDAFGYTLSPRQKAVAIVRSFPFFPDMYSVSTAALGAQHPAQLAGPQPAGLLTAATASQ